MTAKEYVKLLDWSSAIAAATLELDPNSSQTNQQGQTNQGTCPQCGKKQTINNDEESYLYRGIAHCFIANKEGKHKEAIEDISKAIVLLSNKQGTNIDEAYYYRAYAYYLDGDYISAIKDCECISNNNACSKDELLGKIYSAMGKYEKAVNKFAIVIKSYYSSQQIPCPALLESYHEACKRMNSV